MKTHFKTSDCVQISLQFWHLRRRWMNDSVSCCFIKLYKLLQPSGPIHFTTCFWTDGELVLATSLKLSFILIMSDSRQLWEVMQSDPVVLSRSLRLTSDPQNKWPGSTGILTLAWSRRRTETRMLCPSATPTSLSPLTASTVPQQLLTGLHFYDLVTSVIFI